MHRPSFQFYPGDWLHDSALRTVSVAARGLWIEMLCIMHQSEPYGYLKVNHKVILTPNLARIIGATFEETEGWLIELEDAGVFSKSPDGSIFSRRMVRDEKVRISRASGGILGGNPKLKVNLKDNLNANHIVNLALEDEDEEEEKEKEEVQEEKKPKRKRNAGGMVIPTLDEVKEQMNGKDYHFTPEEFWEFYMANGWVQGHAGKPVRNWHYCLGTFERQRHRYSNGQRQVHPGEKTAAEIAADNRRCVEIGQATLNRLLTEDQ